MAEREKTRLAKGFNDVTVLDWGAVPRDAPGANRIVKPDLLSPPDSGSMVVAGV